jgi:NAD(P)-dependent dehydrogenase (short-subunit alcohol dehydrogenase family)
LRKLDGKVAIVTGAGRGIGRGIAIVLAREGASVVVASRTSSAVEEVVSFITKEGNSAIGVPVDVADHDRLRALVTTTVQTFSTVDILVNNAQSFGTPDNPAGTPPITPVESMTEAEWTYTYATGVVATLRLMQLVFPYMKDRGGKIINFGSRAGQRGNEYMSAYGSNKEAIRGLSRSAAREWGRYKINVNIISPLVASGSTEAMNKQEPGRMARSIQEVPMGRLGDPIRDAGPLAVFLASSDSDYITGQTIVMDGGRYTFA